MKRVLLVFAFCVSIAVLVAACGGGNTPAKTQSPTPVPSSTPISTVLLNPGASEQYQETLPLAEYVRQLKLYFATPSTFTLPSETVVYTTNPELLFGGGIVSLPQGATPSAEDREFMANYNTASDLVAQTMNDFGGKVKAGWNRDGILYIDLYDISPQLTSLTFAALVSADGQVIPLIPQHVYNFAQWKMDGQPSFASTTPVAEGTYTLRVALFSRKENLGELTNAWSMAITLNLTAGTPIKMGFTDIQGQGWLFVLRNMTPFQVGDQVQYTADYLDTFFGEEQQVMTITEIRGEHLTIQLGDGSSKVIHHRWLEKLPTNLLPGLAEF